MRLGVEIGGTFTDLILTGAGPDPLTLKVPSTPDDPSRGALEGMKALLDKAQVAWSQVTEVLHGSTVATNALIERKGATTGLITTKGFEDVLLIGRQEKSRIYDPFYQRPPSLVPRELIRGVTERLAPSGAVVSPLAEDEVLAAARDLVDGAGIASLAIVFLHAYRDPAHERRAAELIQSAYPDLDVTISSDIAPEFREYERTSTTVVNAYVRPVVRRYVTRLSQELAALGYGRNLMIMQSNGGVLPAEAAAQLPVRMVLSGPAAGVTGAAEVARRADLGDLITVDIGGTSCDVSIISRGVPEMVSKGLSEYRIDGNPINIRMMDIATVGAGGGSIAFVDGGGLLRVGPLSAGAQPGPACYGRGGTDFTVTDALVLLGLIDPNRFIGGQMRIDPALSTEAARPLCERLGIDAEDLARSVYRITVNNIAQAVRQVTVQRGRDPRDYAILPYGGGGAIFAASVAEELGMSEAIVPRLPGIFSSYGLTAAPMRLDFTTSTPGTRLSTLAPGSVAAALDALEEAARAEFARFGAAGDALALTRFVDARYVGQGFELTVPVEASEAGQSAAEVASRFHQAHADRYGHAFEDLEVEIVGYRLDGVVRQEADEGTSFAARDGAADGRMEVALDKSAPWRTIDRTTLGPGATFDGPAIVFEPTSATLVPPDWSVAVDEAGDLRLTRNPLAKE